MISYLSCALFAIWGYLVFLRSREKEDLTQQVSEIKNKLQRKMDECLILERSRDENTRKLSEKQDLIQQVYLSFHVCILIDENIFSIFQRHVL